MAFASSAILPIVPAMLPGTGGNLFDEQLRVDAQSPRD
jgi:hypothetical protein